MESSLFPNTITYLTAITVVGVIVTVAACILWLSCSNYTVETSTYLRLSFNLPNLLFFLGVILTQYFAAASSNFHVNPDYILLAVGGLALFCGSYFFFANAMLNSKIRNPIFCREDPVTKNRTAGYSTGHRSSHPTPELEESVSSSQSTLQQFQRDHARRSQTPMMNNLNYVSDYLSPRAHAYSHQLNNHVHHHGRPSGVGMNPVPLSLFGQVQQGAGRVRRYGDTSHNPAYRLDFSSDI